MLPTRVDFYLINDEAADAREQLACRLIEKALDRNHRIFVYCPDKATAENLDELLWIFKEESFIPHNLQGEGPDTPPPVQIGYAPPPHCFSDILVNLTEVHPDFFSRFHRVIEIILPDEASREKSRTRYRQYRTQGCNLHLHDLTTNAILRG